MNDKNDYIYLDHAATSWPKPVEVLDHISTVLTGFFTNAGRSGHQAAVESARMVFETRELLSGMLGVQCSDDLVFQSGCTQGLNLVIKGFLKPKDRVAVSPMEHNAVMRPLIRMVQDHGIEVETLPADPLGALDLDGTRRIVENKGFALLIVAHASNVNGVVQDLQALRQATPDVPILVDAAQTAGVLPIDVIRIGIDFLSCSIHKGLRGPAGVGACYLSPRHEVRPLQEGGTGSRSESFEHPTFRPDRYEAGTLNLHGIAGTFGALLAAQKNGLSGDHKKKLAKMLILGLGEIPGATLYSPCDGSALSVSFTLSGMKSNEVATYLEEKHQILCRPGLHCAPAAHKHLGTFPEGTVRLSPGDSNTESEIETTLRALHEIGKR